MGKNKSGHNGLIGTGPDEKFNACVGANGGRADFAKIAKGYFLAGSKLVKEVQETRQGMDVLVYPIVFCFRHGVECFLKHLVRELASYHAEKGIFKLDHDLKMNMKKVKEGFLRLPDPHHFLEHFGYVESRINELIEIDKIGDQFRYPEDKKGSPTLRDTTHVNIPNFGEQMQEVVSRLDALDMQLKWGDRLLGYLERGGEGEL